MLIEAFLRGFVVIRSDEQGAVCAGFFGKFGELNGFDGVVGAGASENLDASFHLIDADLDDLPVLFMGKRGGFARGTDGDETVDAFFNLPVNKPAEGLFIDLAIPERRDDGGHNSGKQHKISPLPLKTCIGFLRCGAGEPAAAKTPLT